MNKIDANINSEKKGNLGACLLNGLVYPGFGELSIGHKEDGKKWIIYYTVWSVVAVLITLLSIGIMIPVVFLIDTAIRIYSAYTVYFMEPIKKVQPVLEAKV